MARRHLFIIVVLLGAAAVAGLLATTRTSALGSPSRSPSQDAAISFRLKKLDRLEATLQERLTEHTASTTAPSIVYRRAAASAAASSSLDSYDEEDHEDDGAEHEERDD